MTMALDPMERELAPREEEAPEESGVRARTTPAPPLEEKTHVEQQQRRQLILQCVVVLLIGTALYCCFGGLINHAINMLLGLRRNSWFRESLLCTTMVLLPLVPIIWRYVRRNTQTPRI